MSLNDILIAPLARIPTGGGDVLHAMKQSDAGYAGFGVAYFSWVAAGAIKAWKRHTRMTAKFLGIQADIGQLGQAGVARQIDLCGR